MLGFCSIFLLDVSLDGTLELAGSNFLSGRDLASSSDVVGSSEWTSKSVGRKSIDRLIRFLRTFSIWVLCPWGAPARTASPGRDTPWGSLVLGWGHSRSSNNAGNGRIAIL